MKTKKFFKRVVAAVSGIVMAASLFLSPIPGMSMEAEAAISGSDFLKANGKVLKNNYGNGDTVYLRGTNAGGYLVQEFWMTPTEYSYDNYTVTCEKDIYETLTARFGEQNMRNLIDVYQDNYWTEADFDNCKDLGINCIRLPFWYMNFVDFNGNYIDGCFDRIDWFLQEAGERGIYVILDFHGAPGSQNGSDHSGIDGENDKIGASEFFFGANAYNNQQLYYDIWYKIAQRYANNPTVAAYDLLNEPYCTYRYNSGYSDEQLHNTLWSIYDIAYDVIRSADPNHVIIMEATWDAWDLPNPSDYGWENVMYEYHNYLYDDYDNANGQQIVSMQNKINGINSMNYNVPSYMGEFSYFNNTSAWSQGVALLNNNGLNWTTWTYKVTGSNNNWGLYNQNVSKANVSTDSYDTIYSKWSQVGQSSPNTNLINAIKGYFPGTVSASVSYEAASLADGDYYFVGANSNKVVCGENYGNDPLVANRDSYGGAWETLTVVNNGDGTISLKSGANNNYVCAVIDESNQLLARSSSIGTWEKFKVVKVSDTEYGLQSVANNKYVCVNEDAGNVLYADRDSISGWESFRIYQTNGTQVTPGSSNTGSGNTGSGSGTGNDNNGSTGGGDNAAQEGVTMYIDINYTGGAVTFGAGSYNMNDMIVAGIPNDSVTSIKVPEGYKVTAFWDINFAGASVAYTADTAYVGNDWNDQITSFIVEKVANNNNTNNDSNNNTNNNSSNYVLADGNYYLVDSQGKVVCGENYGNDSLIANRDACGGAWETITIVNNSDGTVSLLSGANGKYVCAVIDESNQLLARSSAIGDWEKFYLEKLADGKYALKAVANGKYVCADQNKSSVLYADRDSVGGWEAFSIYSLN